MVGDAEELAGTRLLSLHAPQKGRKLGAAQPVLGARALQTHDHEQTVATDGYFSTATAGLAEVGAPELLDLSGGETVELRATGANLSASEPRTAAATAQATVGGC